MSARAHFIDAKVRNTFETLNKNSIETYRRGLNLRSMYRSMAGPDGFSPEDNSQLYSLREGLVNMLAHADYFSPIHSTVLVYTDKFEFQNAGQFPIALTKKNGKVKSVPRNPNIIMFFRYARLAENAGYGIGKIMQWKELTGEKVEIDSELSASTVTYWRPLGGQKSGQKSGQKNEEPLITTRERLLNIIKANPKVTRSMLVEELHIAPSAIQRHINTLKAEGKIERIGAAKGGYWKVND